MLEDSKDVKYSNFLLLSIVVSLSSTDNIFVVIEISSFDSRQK